jgi:galactonate dehydratase
MKISKVKVYQVRGRGWPSYPWIWVEVFTDEGVSGIGESAVTEGVVEAIRGLGRRIVGEDPFNIEKIFESAYRRGALVQAISGVEMALWDILGKKLGQPIYNLLGGRCRDKIRVYEDGFFRGAKYSPEEYAEKAREAVNKGFTAIKADIDVGPSMHQLNMELSADDLALNVSVVKAVREAVGSGIDVAVDTHGAFSEPSMIKLARKLEPYDLMWIEDPVPLHGQNLRTLAKLTEEIRIPVCVGETLSTRSEFRELFELGAADLIMPDICYTGGILEMKKIAAMADAYHVPLCPHNYLGPISTMANIQVCTCVPNFMVLEFQGGDVDWRDTIFDEPVPLRNGYLEIPSKPGLGVELNREELAKHLVG